MSDCQSGFPLTSVRPLKWIVGIRNAGQRPSSHSAELRVEVRHPDRADFARPQELLLISPSLDICWAFAERDYLVVLRVGPRPVYEVHIDIFDAKLVEGLLQGLRDFVVMMIRERGRQEDLIAKDTALADRLSDLLFVHIPVRLQQILSELG